MLELELERFRLWGVWVLTLFAVQAQMTQPVVDVRIVCCARPEAPDQLGLRSALRQLRIVHAMEELLVAHFGPAIQNPRQVIETAEKWMAEEEDSFAPKPLIPRKLLILRLAEMAKLAEKRRFGSFDSQTRYSNSAIWQRAPESFKPSPHKAILLVLAAGIGDLFPAFPTAATFSWETLRDRWRNWAGRYSRRRPNRRRDVEIRPPGEDVAALSRPSRPTPGI